VGAIDGPRFKANMDLFSFKLSEEIILAVLLMLFKGLTRLKLIAFRIEATNCSISSTDSMPANSLISDGFTR